MIASLPRPLLFSRDLECSKGRPGPSVDWLDGAGLDGMWSATVVAKIVADAAVFLGLRDMSAAVEREWFGIVGSFVGRGCVGPVESCTTSRRGGRIAVEWSKRWGPRRVNLVRFRSTSDG